MTDIVLTRRIDSPIDEVWRAWTDESVFASWFWPPRLEPVYELEARPGGRWRVASPVASMAVGGEFTAVDGPERLAFTWIWEGETARTVVEVRLSVARGRSTLLDLTHTGIDGEATATDLRQGWNDCLDRLPSAIGG